MFLYFCSFFKIKVKGGSKCVVKIIRNKILFWKLLLFYLKMYICYGDKSDERVSFNNELRLKKYYFLSNFISKRDKSRFLFRRAKPIISSRNSKILTLIDLEEGLRHRREHRQRQR